MARRNLRAESYSRREGFQQSQKKSSSGLTVFLLLLLLGSLGFSFYIYQENTKIAEEITSVKIKNADLSNQIKRLTAKISPLENKISEMTLLSDSPQKNKDELSTEDDALEKIIINKNTEILDLQSQLVQSNDQIDDLSDEVTELKIQLSTIISSSLPGPVSNLPQPVKSCNSTNAILQEKPAPAYPRRALQRNIEGAVRLKFDVSNSGNIINVTVVSSPDNILSSAAINAAEKLKFKPAEDCDGNFVIDREVTTIYRFTLN